MFLDNGYEQMLVSMTGFGRATGEHQGITGVVEVRSVNHRFLEVLLQLPRRYFEKENEIRSIVKRYAVRGKITITATIQNPDLFQQSLSYQPERAAAYYQLLRQLQSQLKIREQIKLEHLLRFSDIFEQSEPAELSEAEWTLFQKLLQEALHAMRTMRRKEGEFLTKDIQQRLKKIQQLLEKVEKLSIQRIPRERERLQQRIAQLFESDEIDEYRLEMEIALLADKLDVTEECVRLRSHLEYAHRLLRTRKTEVGRQLNFLIQEMHRETNTIGAKANDAEISQLVVQMKEEIEKIREQVQNAE